MLLNLICVTKHNGSFVKITTSEYLSWISVHVFFISKLFNNSITISMYHEHWNHVNRKQMYVILRIRFWPSTQSCNSQWLRNMQSAVCGERRIATFIQAMRWATNMHITAPYNISVHWGISHRIALNREADGLQQLTATWWLENGKNVACTDNGECATVREGYFFRTPPLIFQQDHVRCHGADTVPC